MKTYLERRLARLCVTCSAPVAAATGFCQCARHVIARREANRRRTGAKTRRRNWPSYKLRTRKKRKTT